MFYVNINRPFLNIWHNHIEAFDGKKGGSQFLFSKFRAVLKGIQSKKGDKITLRLTQ